MKWYYLKDRPNSCIAFGTLVGKEIKDIQAKVWRIDGGEWAHACNSSACKNDLEDFTITSAGKNFVGIEPTRDTAIEAVMRNLKEEFL